VKEEILEQVFAMFLEKGFSDISTNEIIREAGLTKGGFYYAFKSREELIRRINETYIRPYFFLPLEQMKKNWDERRDDDTTQELMWRCFFEPQRFSHYLDHIEQQIVFRDFYFLLYEGMKRFAQVQEYSRAQIQARQQYLMWILERGRQRGEISGDIELEDCVTMILAMQDGILALKVMDESIDDEEKYRNVERQILKDIGTERDNPYLEGGAENAVS